MREICIAVDAMGGDGGCGPVVEGAALALGQNPKITKIILVGNEGVIEPLLSKLSFDLKGRLEIAHAPQVIAPEESPITALKSKKDSSIVVGLNLVKNKTAEAFVSAGSTGALLAGATMIIGRVPGIKRPALGVMIPRTTKGHTLLIDAGANMDAKAEYLLQFAQMGAVYMGHMMDVANPRVGLINVGGEKEKGNAVTKAAYELLEAAALESGLNFVGNVEGREISGGDVDVVACDGFVGNIILKYFEGHTKGVFALLKEELMSSFVSKLGGALCRSTFKRIRKRFDYTEVGGAPFIGLNGLVVKAHGSSNAKAIKNSIMQCARFIEADVVAKIESEIVGEDCVRPSEIGGVE